MINAAATGKSKLAVFFFFFERSNRRPKQMLTFAAPSSIFVSQRLTIFIIYFLIVLYLSRGLLLLKFYVPVFYCNYKSLVANVRGSC